MRNAEFPNTIKSFLAQLGKLSGCMPFQVDKLDLELAWRRAKNDLHTGRVFVHLPFEELLIEANKEEWLQRLSDSIAAGYRPRSALIADIPKGNGAVRPAALLCIEDRVVYAAAVGAILPSINAGLRWSQGTVDYSYRLSESPRRVDWFTNPFNIWSAFRRACIERSRCGRRACGTLQLTRKKRRRCLITLYKWGPPRECFQH